MDCEVLIIGGGPAGLSAATVLGRCLRRVILCDAGDARNSASESMHCFLSRDGIRPKAFLDLARADLAMYESVELRRSRASSAEIIESGFRVQFDGGDSLTSKILLLATGVRDILPDIEGIEAFYGRSVHHCPYCDGFEHRGNVIAVYGFDEKGVGLAKLMRQWTAEVVLCSHGDAALSGTAAELSRSGIMLRTQRMTRLEGDDGHLRRIHFESGAPLNCSALFFNTGQYQRSPLLEQLDCRFDEKGGVETNEREETCVPGLYVAGDASRDLQFVIMAAAEGAKAAVAINAALLGDQ